MSAERTWTGNSEVDAAIVMLDRIDCSPEDDSRVDEVEATLRRQHARIQELEAHITKLTTWKNEGELEIRAWDTMKEQERKIIELEKCWKHSLRHLMYGNRPLMRSWSALI